MQLNAQSFVDFFPLLHTLWSAPLQVLLTFVLLWFYIGWAMFAGLGIMLLLIGYNLFLSYKYNALTERNMQIKDRRIKMTNEILNGIKVEACYCGFFFLPVNKIKHFENF